MDQDNFIFIKRHLARLINVSFVQIICIVILSLFPGTTKSQIGIKLGTTISNFYYTDRNMDPYLAFDIDLRPYLGYDIEGPQLGDQKPLISASVSVYYNFKLSNRFGLRPEISFTQKGVSFNQFEYERVIYKVIINYLEIPLSIAYQFIKKEKFITELYLGGFAAFNMGAVKKVANHNSQVEKTKIDNTNKVDGGIHLGLTFKYKISEDFVLLDLRLFEGLSDIFTMPEDQPKLYYSTQKTKITGVNITIGYEF